MNLGASMSIYGESHRKIQDSFDSRRLADRLEEFVVHDELSDAEVEFVESREMFFLATVDENGHLNNSYKGGAPGFLKVVDRNTIAFPNYDGNGMYLSTGNISASGEVALLLIDFQKPTRTRINGTASVSADDPLMEEWPGATLVVRITTREIFSNCPRYIHKMEFVDRSKDVPSADHTPPTAEWKKMAALRDALPANDPALLEDD